tara:strand:- start:297 stop:683 length:387 start_codon:yes stop_codon:yes gene_type:complete
MKYDIVDAFRMLCEDGNTWSSFSNTYESIEWNSSNSQTKPTEEQCNAKLTEITTAEPHRLLRIERDRRLTECDWVVTKHTEHGKMVPEKWKIYRQALRDLPNISYRPELDEYGDLKMDSVAWPTPPSD